MTGRIQHREERAAQPLAARIWDTRDVRPREAFGYYREGICEAFMELVPEAGSDIRERFRARVASTPVGGGALNRVQATSHQVLRTRREIAAAPGECFYLNYQLGGACEINQAGEAVTLRPGDVGIFDSTSPFLLEHRSRPSLGVASFWVPREALLERLPESFGGRAVMLSRHDTIGRLVMETARSLSDGIDWMPPDMARRLFDMLLDLTAMVLAGEGRARTDAPRTRAAATFLQLKATVDRRCGDPRFGVAQCAAAAGISERYVHKLFAANGPTFGAYLLEQRLLMAAGMLREPGRAHLPIATIAYDCGFSDLSHFGRAFRRRFDRTPGEWRRRRD